MIRFTLSLAIAATLLGCAGCKGTEDYLQDLQTVHDEQGRVRIEVYDAGQLVHEALAGIADADALSLSQLARAVSLSGRVVDRNDIALCQAQAILLLAQLAERYPVPAVTEPYRVTDPAKVKELAIDAATNRLARQTEILAVETQYLPGIKNADKAVVEKNLDHLREALGQDLGSDAKAWEAWWEQNRPRIIADVVRESEAPLRELGDLRFTNLTGARSVLLFLGLSVGLSDFRELREINERTVLRLGRQVVVFSIDAGLRRVERDFRIRGDDSSQSAPRVSIVHQAAAQAAKRVVDPQFAEGLLYAISRERDVLTRSMLLDAMGCYPNKEIVKVLVTEIEDPDPVISRAAQRSLVQISGEDYGPSPAAWKVWFDRAGKSRWP